MLEAIRQTSGPRYELIRKSGFESRIRVCPWRSLRSPSALTFHVTRISVQFGPKSADMIREQLLNADLFWKSHCDSCFVIGMAWHQIIYRTYVCRCQLFLPALLSAQRLVETWSSLVPDDVSGIEHSASPVLRRGTVCRRTFVLHRHSVLSKSAQD